MPDRLDARLVRIFEAPPLAKLVDGLLGITAEERRRWSKDRKLWPLVIVFPQEAALASTSTCVEPDNAVTLDELRLDRVF